MSDFNVPPENSIADILDEGAVIHFMCQDEDGLVERDYACSTLSPPEPIGAARQGTPGAYVILESKVCTSHYYLHVFSLLR